MKKELLIFGANGALGKGVTEALVSKDYEKIYLFDFKFDNFGKYSGSKIEQILVSDLSDEKNVENAFKNVSADKNKSIFLYTTIGGFTGGKKTWETSSDDWDNMMLKNLKTSFLIAKHFAKLVNNSLSGSICFTAAYTGLFPETAKAAYGTSKAALVHFIKTFALEASAIRLSVNAIAPFIIDTEANRGWMRNADYNSWVKPIEVGELAHSLFNYHNFVTGNIIQLTDRFSID